jgi:hypothetical protein
MIIFLFLLINAVFRAEFRNVRNNFLCKIINKITTMIFLQIHCVRIEKDRGRSRLANRVTKRDEEKIAQNVA